MEHKNLYGTPWKNKGLIGTNYVIVCSQGLPIAIVPNVATVNKDTNTLIPNAGKQTADLITSTPNLLAFAKTILDLAESGAITDSPGNTIRQMPTIIKLAKSVIDCSEIDRATGSAPWAAP